MLVIGWGLLPITLFHFVPLFFSALSWRELLPLSSRPDVMIVTWILAALRHHGPYPVLSLFGEGGTAKSTLLKLLGA